MPGLPFEYAARNLGRSPSRLFLSLTGSAIVAGLILAAGAFVRGMESAIRSTGRHDNAIILGAGSEDSIERSEIPPNAAGILAASIPGLRARAGVTYLSPEVHVQLPLAVPGHDPTGKLVLVRGVTPAALLVHDQLRITDGRLPATGHDELMVGAGAATKLGLPEDDLALGGTLILEERPWTIVGRFAAPGTVTDAEIWTNLNDLKTAMKRETDSCIILTLHTAEFADIDAFAKTRLDLEIVAMPERDYYDRLAAFFAPIRFIAWATAALIALGGLMGGLTTMHAAFASRIRELGTLRAIGFRKLAILRSLIQESLIAATAGSLAACAIGILALDGIAVRFSMGVFGLRIDAASLGIALAGGFALGLIGALPPAWRCLRPSIPESLRSF